jgi:hypothetical protein
MVITTSAACTLSSVSGLGNSREIGDHPVMVPSLRYCLGLNSWRMRRNDAARATSRSGAATPPWSDAGRSPAPSRGRDRRPAGWMCLDLTAPPEEDAAASTGQRECLLIPLGTEGRPGPGTGAT